MVEVPLLLQTVLLVLLVLLGAVVLMPVVMPMPDPPVVGALLGESTVPLGPGPRLLLRGRRGRIRGPIVSPGICLSDSTISIPKTLKRLLSFGKSEATKKKPCMSTKVNRAPELVAWKSKSILEKTTRASTNSCGILPLLLALGTATRRSNSNGLQQDLLACSIPWMMDVDVDDEGYKE